MQKKNPIVLLVIVFSALLLLGTILISVGPRHDAETIADAKKSGVLAAENVNISFEGVSAKLALRQVCESDLVKKGDILMVLEDTNNNLSIASVKAQTQQNIAQLQSAQANLDRSRKEFRRASSLIKTGAVSQSTFDNAKNDFLAASATVEELQAVRQSLDVSLQQLEVERDRLTLRAPEDGKILSLTYEVGEIVTPSSPAVVLESYRRYFDIYVSEAHVMNFQPGTRVVGYVPALNQTVEGIVRFAQAAPTFADLRMTREHGTADLTSFQVRIDVNDPKVLTGMTIEVDHD